MLRNAAGDAFMERYAPLARDLAPADVAARAVVTEIREGRGGSRHAPGGDHVMLDLTSLPASQWGSAMATAAGSAFTQLGIDAETTPLPVHPTAHYAMGGIPTTADGQVLGRDGLAVPGLFAAGESACVSVHGANRLAANALLEAVVFGRRAGAAAAAHARTTSGRAAASGPAATARFADRAAARSTRVGTLGADPGGVAANHRSAPASVIRSEESLAQAAADVAALKKRYAAIAVTDQGRRYNTDLMEAVELGFLLDIADVMVASAAGRRESRGAHFRADYPARDDARFLHHTLAFRAGPADDRFEFGSRPVDVSHQQPTERSY